ncbi:MAG: hypothetical protein PVJ34_02900, partial [Anaerolineae bacterium]
AHRGIGVHLAHLPPPLRYGPLRYGPLRYGPLRYGPLRYGPLRYGPLRYGPLRYGTPSGRNLVPPASSQLPASRTT